MAKTSEEEQKETKQNKGRRSNRFIVLVGAPLLVVIIGLFIEYWVIPMISNSEEEPTIVPISTNTHSPPTNTPLDTIKSSDPTNTSVPTLIETSPPSEVSESETILITGMEVYDDFEDGCINSDLWSGLSAWNTDEPKISIIDGCLDLAEYGFEEENGYLKISCRNNHSESNYSYTLEASNDKQIAALEILVENRWLDFDYGALGLRFDIIGNWADYTLRYEINNNGEFLGYVSSENWQRKESQRLKLKDLSLNETIKLTLYWDESSLHYLVDGIHYWEDPDYSLDPFFGLLCSLGPKKFDLEEGIEGYIDEIRVKYR